MNEYLMLIREDLENAANMSAEAMQNDIAEHVRWVEELVQKGHFKGGDPLSPEGKHIRGAAGLVTDGPYVELKEGISGYYFLLAESLEQVTEIAKTCPALKSGCSLELRPIYKFAAD